MIHSHTGLYQWIHILRMYRYFLCMMMRIQRSKTCVHSSCAHIFRCIYQGFMVALPFIRSKTTSYFGRWVESLMSLERSSQKALFCLPPLDLQQLKRYSDGRGSWNSFFCGWWIAHVLHVWLYMIINIYITSFFYLCLFFYIIFYIHLHLNLYSHGYLCTHIFTGAQKSDRGTGI